MVPSHRKQTRVLAIALSATFVVLLPIVLAKYDLFRLSIAWEGMVCAPKVFGVAPMYCGRDEAADEEAGFHQWFDPPLHMIWCNCFFTSEEE